MRILFFDYRGGTFFDRWYAKITGGTLSRVQIEFSDGQRFGVNVNSGKLQFNPGKENWDEWYGMELPKYERSLRCWAECNVGRKVGYNWRFLLGLKPLFIRAFGVEEISNALFDSGYCCVPYTVSPDDLEAWLIEWYECCYCGGDYYPCMGSNCRIAETLSWE